MGRDDAAGAVLRSRLDTSNPVECVPVVDPDALAEAAGNTLADLAEARWRAEAVALAQTIELWKVWASWWRRLLPDSERK